MATTAINITDSLALVALYNSTDGPNWIDNTNWLTGPVSSWHGITVESGRVTRIIIHENNMLAISLEKKRIIPKI